MKTIGKPAIILCLICFVTVFLMAFVHDLTLLPIEKQKLQTENSAMQIVYPNGDKYEEIDISGWEEWKSKGVQKAFQVWKEEEIKAMIINCEVKGYSQGLLVMTAVDVMDKKILSIEILKHNETPSLGAEAATKEFKDRFIDKEYPVVLKKIETGNVHEVHTLTGATITSRAVIDAANLSCEACVSFMNGGN